MHEGQSLLVHSSMRMVGQVVGGASTVVRALRNALGASGTLVVPTFTSDNSDTSKAYLARTAHMTVEEARKFRSAMPAFDVSATPSSFMGRIAEKVRTSPGAIRSIHPQTSFSAIGPLAHKLISGHAINCHLGDSSPLARLYDSCGWILFIGVGYEACSAFHLAEYRYSESPPMRTYRCVINVAGRATWWEYSDVCLDDSDLGEFGKYNDRTGLVKFGSIGNAHCRLMPVTETVDRATDWLRKYRPSRTASPLRAVRIVLALLACALGGDRRESVNA